MKNTFRRPEELNFEEFDTIISELKVALNELIAGDFEMSECKDFIGKHLENQDENGFWGLIDPESAPSEARIDFFYMPTYYSTAFLIKFLMDYPDEVKGFPTYMDILSKGLKASTGRSFTGHGYDSTIGVIDTMKIFCSVDIEKFILKYPSLCPEFNTLVLKTIEEFKEAIKKGDTKDGWGTDYAEGFMEIIRNFDSKQELIK